MGEVFDRLGASPMTISRTVGVSFSLASFGLSLVVEKPTRREFLSLYIDGLEGRLKTKGIQRSFEFIVMDLQIDNYSESAIYPVLLHSTKKEIHSSVDMGDDEDHGDHDNDEDEDDDEPQQTKSSRSRQGSGIAQMPYDSSNNNGGGSSSMNPLEVALLQITLIEELPRGGSNSSSILKVTTSLSLLLRLFMTRSVFPYFLKMNQIPEIFLKFGTKKY